VTLLPPLHSDAHDAAGGPHWAGLRQHLRIDPTPPSAYRSGRPALFTIGSLRRSILQQWPWISAMLLSEWLSRSRREPASALWSNTY
jgi:hypothetical protein